ncbi:MAG: hypothetical protein K2J08_04905 [Ruminococcus sp.]|nr:hypothetical protein [Ruminococcus sp.]
MRHSVSEKTFIISSVLIVFLAYFFTTSESVLTVHDDILTYAEVRHGDLLKTVTDYAENGRINHIPMTVLLWIPYYFNSVTAVRILSAMAVAFDMCGLFFLVKNNSTKNTACLVCLLFISFACISNQHSLFTAYTFAHQFPIGVILFSLDLFIKYLKIGKKSYRIKSAVLFFVACFMYESVTVFLLMFIGLSLYFSKGKIFRERFVILIKDLFFHGTLLFVYLIIYCAWRYFHPSYYDGTRFYFGNILLSLTALVKFSVGTFPMLPAVAMILKKYITFSEFLKSISVWNFTAPVISGMAFYRVFPKIKISVNTSEAVVFCLAGMLFPNVLISLTEKYTDWALQNAYSYVPSFYSYFFMIMLAVVVLIKIFRNPTKRVMIILSLAVSAITLVCSFSNTAWNTYFNKNLEKYKAFEEAVSSDFFDDVTDGTVIYIPDFSGIHNDMELTAYYAEVFIGADVTFTNEKSQIDFSKPVVAMYYDSGKKKIFIEKINSQGGNSNTFNN